MPSVRRTPLGRYELTISSKLLPRRVYLTFDTEKEAHDYGRQCAAWLKAGIVPEGLAAPAKKAPTALLGPLIKDWIKTGQPSKSDVEILDLLFEEVGTIQLRGVTYAWAESWVQGLKHEKNLAPGTIRKRVQALRIAATCPDPGSDRVPGTAEAGGVGDDVSPRLTDPLNGIISSSGVALPNPGP